jgi:hypothetical protein
MFLRGKLEQLSNFRHETVAVTKKSRKIWLSAVFSMSIVSLPIRRTAVVPASSPAPLAQGYAPAFALLDLNGLTPVACGAERLVYQHPYDASLLVKVLDSSSRHAYVNLQTMRRLRNRFQREGAYRNHIAELSEYVAAQNVAAGRWSVPMARVLGVAQTSLGLGLLVEKISDGNGGLAPTVEQLIAERGLDAALTRQLDFFFDALADNHIILNDISARNIVAGENTEGNSGLFLIDGFGSKQAIPIYACSKTLNRRRIQRKYQKMMYKLQLRASRQLKPEE